MSNIIKCGGGGLNTRDIAPQVKNLTLIGGDKKIDASFTGVDAEYLPLVKYYRVVAKIGSLPASPTDGAYVDLLVLLLPGVSASGGIKNYFMRIGADARHFRRPTGNDIAPTARRISRGRGRRPLPHVPPRQNCTLPNSGHRFTCRQKNHQESATFGCGKHRFPVPIGRDNKTIQL